MTKTILTSREFNQDASGAKRAARKGPVIITDRGRPAHVLLTIEAYQKLTQKSASIAELLAMPGVADIPFEAPRMGRMARPADLDGYSSSPAAHLTNSTTNAACLSGDASTRNVKPSVVVSMVRFIPCAPPQAQPAPFPHPFAPIPADLGARGKG